MIMSEDTIGGDNQSPICNTVEESQNFEFVSPRRRADVCNIP